MCVYDNSGEIPAEIAFITSAVRPEPDVDRIETLTARNLDWEQVIQRGIHRHRVGPLLYRNLIASGADRSVPGDVLERLRQHSRRTSLRNLSLTDSLLSILGRLDEAEIPALPYKGPALSEALYGDFSLRQSRDLDILIRPADLDDAEAVLLNCGFEPKRELTGKQRQLLVRNGRHRTMKKGGTIVELHPRISSPDPPFEVSTLLERAGTVNLTGDPTPAIGPTDTLFVLSVHGTRHRWNQLKWICDVGYLLHHETFDWPTVLEESKQRNCYRRLLLGCGLASAVLGVELAEVVRSRSGAVRSRLIDETYPDCLLGIDDTTSLRYRLRSRDDLATRLQYCWNGLTVPSVQETMSRPIPERFFELHYVLHPVRAMGSKLILAIRTLGSNIRSK